MLCVMIHCFEKPVDFPNVGDFTLSKTNKQKKNNQITATIKFVEIFSPIRKLPYISDLYPSEDRQNEINSHRKLTKLITWAPALSNSMELSHAV